MRKIVKRKPIDFDQEINIELTLRELVAIRVALGLSVDTLGYQEGLMKYGSATHKDVSNVSVRELHEICGDIMESEGFNSFKEYDKL